MVILGRIVSGEVWAFYRAYYGGDTIRLSIESIKDQVDRVFVFYRRRPFFDLTHVEWEGERIEVPDDVDGLLGNVPTGVECVEHQCASGRGQVPHIVNEHIFAKYGRPHHLLYMSTDYLLQDGAVERGVKLAEVSTNPYLTFTSIPAWRYLSYRLPFRGRHGAFLLDTTKFDYLPYVDQECGLRPYYTSVAHTIDLSWASSPPTMLWKHLLRTAHAPLIPDDTPIPEWYDRWLAWVPGTVGEEWGWCKGEREVGEPYEMALQDLPTCARGVALTQPIPDRWASMGWRKLLSEKAEVGK